MLNKKRLAHALAVSITCGTWDEASIRKRILYTFDDPRLNADLLAKFLNDRTKAYRQPSRAYIEELIHDHAPFSEWILKLKHAPKYTKISLDTSVAHSVQPAYLTGDIPDIATYNDLALWLRLTPNDLAWFADCQGRQGAMQEQKLHHYRYKWIKKKRGSLRLIEIPKSGLKSVQRQILSAILDHIPPHNSVHGFRKGRSCKTHAQQHLGQDTVIRMDLENFFHSIEKQKVFSLFSCLGYPREVARTLAALCVSTPSPVLMGVLYTQLPWQKQKVLLRAHLPQGAPTSPALANLCAWNFDKRLQGLGDKMGFTYSRYADDIAFSGGRALRGNFAYIRKVVEVIAQDEGFRVNQRKTCLLTQAQRQSLAGIVVNQHPNIARDEYDRLKATLYNCGRGKFADQNRDQHEHFQEHLRGRIAHIESIHPKRARKLLTLYHRINWDTVV